MIPSLLFWAMILSRQSSMRSTGTMETNKMEIGNGGPNFMLSSKKVRDLLVVYSDKKQGIILEFTDDESDIFHQFYISVKLQHEIVVDRPAHNRDGKDKPL